MYSPKIKEELIPELYRLKQSTKKPMTTLVNEAITEYLSNRKEIFNNEQHTQPRPGEDRDQSSGENYQRA